MQQEMETMGMVWVWVGGCGVFLEIIVNLCTYTNSSTHTWAKESGIQSSQDMETLSLQLPKGKKSSIYL